MPSFRIVLLVVFVVLVIALAAGAASGSGFGGFGGGGGPSTVITPPPVVSDGGGGGGGSSSDTTSDALGAMVWTYGSGGQRARLYIDTTTAPRTLVLQSSRSSTAPWVTTWDSASGVHADAVPSASDEIALLARQGFVASDTLIDMTAASESQHALWLRGRWFFVGAAPWLQLAWSPLCAAYPLADAPGMDVPPSFWLPPPPDTPPSPVTVLTAPDASAVLVLTALGDLQLQAPSGSPSETVWSALASSPSAVVAAGCRP
jgi:hypothetical protein